MSNQVQERNAEITFLRELAIALKIPLIEAGLSHPQHIVGERLSVLQSSIGEAAISAIMKQRMAGQLALKAYQKYGPPSLIHGSYLPPQALSPASFRSAQRIHPVLRPQQAFWRDADGRLYKDGDPAICTSDDFTYPLLRSQLNRNHMPDFEGLAMSSRMDITGTVYDFTSLEFLTMLRNGGNTGWVYMINRIDKPEYQEKYYDPVTKKAWEYRLFEDVYPVAWVATNLCDLPPELIVIEGDSNNTYKFLRTLPQATLMDLVRQFDGTLNIQPLGGSFPLALHPNLGDKM